MWQWWLWWTADELSMGQRQEGEAEGVCGRSQEVKGCRQPAAAAGVVIMVVGVRLADGAAFCATVPVPLVAPSCGRRSAAAELRHEAPGRSGDAAAWLWCR